MHRTLLFAKKAHKGQKRKNGEPYIIHPIAVMKKLEDLGIDDKNILKSALLHDVCEECSIDARAISDAFGEDVGFFVYALTKEPKLFYQGSGPFMESRFYFYIKKLDWAFFKKPELIFVKVSDQIDNLKSMHVFTNKKQERKKNEVNDYFIPLYQKYIHFLSPELQDKFHILLNELIDVCQNEKNVYSSFDKQERKKYVSRLASDYVSLIRSSCHLLLLPVSCLAKMLSSLFSG